MKKLIYFLSIAVFFALYSCKNNEAENSNNIALAEGWEILDLSAPQSSFSMPFLINIPGADITKGVANVLESNNGGTQINAGANYNVEILPAAADMNQKKAEIASDGIFKISYEIDEPNLILYKAEIEGTDVVQYHFLSFVKVGNTTYEISDIKDNEFSKENIQMMIESSKTLRDKPKA